VGFAPFFLSVFGFVGATFFHGAMIIGLLTFTGIILWRSFKRSLSGLMRSKVCWGSMGLTLLALMPVGGFLIGAISVPYLGDFSQVSDQERIVTRISHYTRSTDLAAYPEWTVPLSPDELFYKGPIRVVYFLFAPFPWDIRSAFQLIGLLDSLLFIVILFFMWRNRKTIWADPAGRLLLLILIAYLFVFGLAVGNFGTGIRHRAKFLVIFIALVAPLLPRIRFRLTSSSS